ncbi:Predicted metalloprotease, contains C-terminal PDZ domain [Colwellia chukchiensis]|uniref:Predicted metalloprotease, contains C-terminal PDZ domain n=1 Tax=Colwellia chukchiensis TaxID=641665 RepID=A0A1H7QQT7_9GAMM|nr:PDZ domain-containing protein [Colwellia chukchiensis]SEL49657.1 Predicted metalloprotease, contains C-terminal PDZ domain [Colwellia chukchiensis]
MIHYQISPCQPNSHLFEVNLTFSANPGQAYTLSLPAWLPGSYMIRDFAKNITEISAVNEQQHAIDLTKIDKQTWSLVASSEQVHVCYQVFAFDLSVRTAYLDSQRGFFNGSSTFLQVKELSDLPCTVTLTPSSLPEHQQWRVATGLPRAKGTAKFQFGDYVADNYQHLIDCPVALGDFDCTEFSIEGVVHHIVFTSKHYGDTARLATDLQSICQHHINLFGEAPFREYWFITHLQAQGFGGLEHKNSTVLQASRFDLPNPQQANADKTEQYKTFLSLCSHEYFHAWHVCRIKPKEFVPYNLQQESYTKQLWAFEGITSYYDDFSLYRTGLIDFDSYLSILAKTATRVHRGTGELKQSVSESSFDAWSKFYQQGPDAVNNIVSYYAKGALIALWLDLTIREKSKQQYSLDTLMRELWIHFGRTGTGTTEDDFINIANILCAEDITTPFKQLLHDSERIDLTDLLAKFGVSLDKRKFAKLNSLETSKSADFQVYFGAQYKAHANGLLITQVLDASPAANAGLAVNDVLIAVDHIKATEQSLPAILAHHPEHSQLSCHYFRDDQLLSSTISITDSPLAGIEFSVLDPQLAKNWQRIIG